MGAWDATFRALARLIVDAWAGLVGTGGAAAGLGGAKVAALVAAATVAVTMQSGLLLGDEDTPLK